MNADGTACAKNAEIGAHPPTQNGLLIHDFDPTYAPPDGGQPRIVFASTRGNLQTRGLRLLGTAAHARGPDQAEREPLRVGAEPGRRAAASRQLTFLLNMERRPSFMSDGRVIFTAEKRAPGFSQLALRRINLDGGDYHPLYAQRGSIGYPEASEVVELADKDFVTIFRTPTTPHGGGALGVFNRSLGIDFRSTDPADYPIDPGVHRPDAAAVRPTPRSSCTRCGSRTARRTRGLGSRRRGSTRRPRRCRVRSSS